jgi:hypothetical protein
MARKLSLEHTLRPDGRPAMLAQKNERRPRFSPRDTAFFSFVETSPDYFTTIENGVLLDAPLAAMRPGWTVT